MKRLLSMLLILGLLAGCGGGGSGGKGPGGEKTNAAMGRYVEEQLAVLEGTGRIKNLHLDGNGDLVFYIVAHEGEVLMAERCVLPAAGGELTRTPADWAEGFSSIRSISEGEDGTGYLVATDAGLQEGVYRLKDGAAERIAVPDLEREPDAGSGMFTTNGGASTSSGAGISVSDGGVVSVGGNMRPISGIRSLPGGDFLLLFGANGISRYSGADGSLLMEYPATGYDFSVGVHDGQLLTGSPDGSEILLYDLATGSKTGNFTYDNFSLTTCLGLDAGGLYLADNTGVYRQTQGGSVWEKLVDGDLTSLSMPTMGLSSVVSDGGSGFYAALNGDSDLRLVHLVYDAETPTFPDTELTIFGLKDSNTIRQAIGEFQRQNPNVRVNFQVMLEEGSSATAEDVIRALNTELLNGSGPDLLLLDGLPVDAYMEKGVLSDMTELLDQLVGDGLMENLAWAYEYEGKRYGVPSRFTVPVMMGEKEAVSGIRSLEDLVARVEAGQSGQPQFLWPSQQLFGETGMLMDYYNACSLDFAGPEGIDEAALADYLSAMTRIQRAELENTPEIDENMGFVITTVSGGSGFETMDPGAMHLGQGEALFHVQELVGQMSLNGLLSGLSGSAGMGGISFGTAPVPEQAELPEFALDLLFGGTGYTPIGSVGIVASSEQQELSREFVAMLLSGTVQDVYLYDGYPVNGQSLDKLTAAAAEDQESDMGFRAMCDKLDTPILVDQVVKEAVESQLKGLLDGTTTPEQAAAAVVEKTRLYLAE